MSKLKADKIKQLSLHKLISRLENDSDFFAYYLKEYSVIEKKSLDKVLKQISLDSELYQKLAFYKMDRNKIVESCDIAAKDLLFRSERLLAIVRHVFAFEKMRSAPRSASDEPGLLMAARKRSKKK